MNVNLVCNPNVATVAADASLFDAAALMRTEPSCASGDLVGVIAVDDITEHLAVQMSRLADLIRLEQDAERRARP